MQSSKIKKRYYIGFGVFVLVTVLTYGVLFYVDMHNGSSDIGPKLKFDWIAAGCSIGAMLASVYLGLIATVQNIMASEQNERLAKINEEQLENTILSQGHPQLRFSKIQRLDKMTNKFHIRLIDIRNTALKKAYTKNISLQPLSEKYKIDEKAQKIELVKDEFESLLQLTYLHEKGNENKGLYMIDFTMDRQLFDAHRYYRLEFETDVVSATGVVSRNKCFALFDTKFEYDGGREDCDYYKVYHQFFEIKGITSEIKYKESKKVDERRNGRKTIL